MEYLWISCELLVTNMVITYPTWKIIISTLSIRSENVDIEMRVRARHANEHSKRLEGVCFFFFFFFFFTGRKKGWRCSLDRISKIYCYRHQKTKVRGVRLLCAFLLSVFASNFLHINYCMHFNSSCCGLEVIILEEHVFLTLSSRRAYVRRHKKPSVLAWGVSATPWGNRPISQLHCVLPSIKLF